MKIFSSRNDIAKNKQAYIEDWTRRKDEFMNQLDDYTLACEEFTDELETKLLDYLSDYSNIEIRVYNDVYEYLDWDDCGYAYYTIYLYYSERSEKAFNLQICMRFTLVMNTNDNLSITEGDPKIDASISNKSDYYKLQHLYELVSNLNEIDWNSVLSSMFEDAPRYSEYVTIDNPKSLDVSQFNDNMINEYFNKISGKDMWILCKYNTAYTGVWIKVISVKQSVVECYVCNNSYHSNSHMKFHGYGNLEKVLSQKKRLKLDRIDVTVPVEIISTEELESLASSEDNS